jgi:hypothetical protein
MNHLKNLENLNHLRNPLKMSWILHPPAQIITVILSMNIVNFSADISYLSVNNVNMSATKVRNVIMSV